MTNSMNITVDGSGTWTNAAGETVATGLRFENHNNMDVALALMSPVANMLRKAGVSYAEVKAYSGTDEVCRFGWDNGEIWPLVSR